MPQLKERSQNINTQCVHPFVNKRRNNTGKSSPRNRAAFSKKHPRDQASSRIYKMARDVYAFDFFVVLVLFGIASMYIIIFDGHSENTDASLILPVSMNSIINSNIDDQDNIIDVLPVKRYFEESLEDAPICRPLDEHEVTFSLAIALSEKDLSMISHHCKRWGISAPISVAVWSNLSPEEVMKKIQSFKYNECRPEQMTIATLSSTDEHSKTTTTTTTSDNYPINQLRNLAIQGIQTSHVISLDIQMWASVDLYETLNAPSVIQELAKNPQLAIVLPAFEINTEKCPTRKQCMVNIPISFDGLIVQLSEKRVYIMDPLDISRQGSTLYRSWVTQAYGQLADIDCVSSNHYEPFLAVRYCEGLPPFQEVLRHEDSVMDKDDKDDTNNNLTSTWIIHLLRLGYSLKQVGGAFLVHFPSINNRSETVEDKTEIESDANNNNIGSSKAIVSHLRKTDGRYSRADFLHWLDKKNPDRRLVQECDDFGAYEYGIS